MMIMLMLSRVRGSCLERLELPFSEERRVDGLTDDGRSMDDYVADGDMKEWWHILT